MLFPIIAVVGFCMIIGGVGYLVYLKKSGKMYKK